MFSKVAGYKINAQKSVAFLYTNKEQSEIKNQKNSIIHNNFQKLKYLEVNLMKEVTKLWNENYKSLKIEINKDIRGWKDIPCSWIGSINIVKITILSKGIYMINAISIKIPMAFFTKIKKSILNFM
jgi:hypothetical protein